MQLYLVDKAVNKPFIHITPFLAHLFVRELKAKDQKLSKASDSLPILFIIKL